MEEVIFKFAVMVECEGNSESEDATANNDVANKIVRAYRELKSVHSTLFNPELNIKPTHVDNDRKITYLYQSKLKNHESFEGESLDILKNIYRSFRVVFDHCYSSSDDVEVTAIAEEAFSVLKEHNIRAPKKEEIGKICRTIRNLKRFLKSKNGRYNIKVFSLGGKTPSSNESDNSQLGIFVNNKDDVASCDKTKINYSEELKNTIKLIKKESTKDLEKLVLKNISLNSGVYSEFLNGKNIIRIILPYNVQQEIRIIIEREIGLIFNAEIKIDEVSRGVYQAVNVQRCSSE